MKKVYYNIDFYTISLLKRLNWFRTNNLYKFWQFTKVSYNKFMTMGSSNILIKGNDFGGYRK